jgi:hypothetical protein
MSDRTIPLLGTEHIQIYVQSERTKLYLNLSIMVTLIISMHCGKASEQMRTTIFITYNTRYFHSTA